MIERRNIPTYETEIGVVTRRVYDAYTLAKESHKDQKRLSGEPYFSHCHEVYKIIKDEWGINNENFHIAALLHDVVEDTKITLEIIRENFGNEVSELVFGVTKLEESTDKQTQEKVLDKTYINPSVGVIKLADRLHNMRTLEFMKRSSQVKKSTETLEMYTKLAESLGMWNVKTELEDLCFRFLYPDEYSKTVNKIDNDRRLGLDFICNVQTSIEQLLNDNNISGRVKFNRSGYWFLKQKIEKQALKGVSRYGSYEDINDLVNFKVELNSLNDCYQMVKEIHEEFGNAVDYDRYDEFNFSNKRINGYQAIQTTINFNKGPVEIVLSTKEMADFNSWGIVSLIRADKDIKDYVLKLVFTPTDSIRFLPKDATVVDFAAAISPRLLAEANSATIDGVEKPLSAVILNASTVRLNLGGPRRAPLEGIEDYALPETRKLISELRILDERDKFIKDGQQVLEEVLIPRGLLVLSDIGDSINSILYKLGCQGIDDLYFMLGSKFLNVESLSKEFDIAEITKEKLGISTIRIKGPDKPRILIDVIHKISGMNKNILHIEQKNTDTDFNVRILVKDMTLEEENIMKEFLLSDSRFNEGIIV